jgi:hypothetical protein
MSNDQVISELQLSASVESAVINAPLDAIDIPVWLLHLPDAEYQRCAPPDHKACGATTTDDGRPMSINVEEINGSLIIQHYVAEVQEPHHCLGPAWMERQLRVSRHGDNAYTHSGGWLHGGAAPVPSRPTRRSSEGSSETHPW